MGWKKKKKKKERSDVETERMCVFMGEGHPCAHAANARAPFRCYLSPSSAEGNKEWHSRSSLFEIQIKICLSV